MKLVSVGIGKRSWLSKLLKFFYFREELLSSREDPDKYIKYVDVVILGAFYLCFEKEVDKDAV